MRACRDYKMLDPFVTADSTEDIVCLADAIRRDQVGSCPSITQSWRSFLSPSDRTVRTVWIGTAGQGLSPRVAF